MEYKVPEHWQVAVGRAIWIALPTAVQDRQKEDGVNRSFVLFLTLLKWCKPLVLFFFFFILLVVLISIFCSIFVSDLSLVNGWVFFGLLKNGGFDLGLGRWVFGCSRLPVFGKWLLWFWFIFKLVLCNSWLTPSSSPLDLKNLSIFLIFWIFY